MANIHWDLFLHSMLERIVFVRMQIIRIWDTQPICDPNALELDDELESYRNEIAELENNNNKIVTSNTIVALSWSIIEFSLFQTAKEINRRLKGSRGITIPCRNRIKHIKRIFFQNKIVFPKTLYNRLVELEVVRNCVVHATGLLFYSRDKVKLKNLLMQRNWITIVENNSLETDQSIVVVKDFIVSILNDFEQFLEDSLRSRGFGPRNPEIES